jgi:hypothetical protein
MLRRAIPVAVCIALVLLGCEKKEPEGRPPVRPPAPRVEAPPGTMPLRPDEGVFVSETPLSIGQYVAYLEGTTQPVPAEHEGALAEEPLTGLDRAEAERCATWHLKRLPTAQEWEQASAAVGARPYPWTEDGAPVAEGAEVFLVQDWLPGTEGEQAARAGRDELAESILAEARRQVADLSARLQAMIEPRRAMRREMWQQIKPVFFALLDREKRVAELTARRGGLDEVVEILQRLVLAKGKLAAAVKAAELENGNAQEAVQAYTDQLAEVRAKVQQVRDELQKSTAAMQEQVVALTRAFEEAGTAETEGALDQAEAVLTEAGAPVETVARAEELQEKLRGAIERLTEAGPAFEGLPTVEEMNARIAELDARIEQLAADEAGAAAMEEAARKIERFGESIERQFLQEDLLVKELEELVGLRARKKAVEANLKGLQEALRAGEPAE